MRGTSVGESGMTDIVDSRQRSVWMAGVRARDTAPELAVRRIAHRMGLRFRLHRKDLPGCLDTVFPKHRLAVFVHGCFWHRHEGCRHASTPKSRIAFWMEKFAANVARDARQKAALRTLGWRVLVIWGCETGDKAAVERKLTALIQRNGPGPERESTPSVAAMKQRPPRQGVMDPSCPRSVPGGMEAVSCAASALESGFGEQT